MKGSFVAPLGCLTLASFLATAPAAEAKAAGLCTISGTINFTPSAAPQGRWDISGGVIDCRGFFFGWTPMLGPGPFVASGSYTAVPSGVGCVEQLGSGTADYWIMTSEQQVHVIEPHSFTLAGAGAFTTPTLRGTFQIPLYDGNCMTTPRTTTLFLAQVTLARAGPLPSVAVGCDALNNRVCERVRWSLPPGSDSFSCDGALLQTLVAHPEIRVG